MVFFYTHAFNNLKAIIRALIVTLTAMDVVDYIRTVGQEELGLRLPREPIEKTAAAQIMEKRRENDEAGELLHAQIEVFEHKRRSLRQRGDGLIHKEEKLKESLLNFDAFLQENDAKCSRSKLKAEKERQAVLQKEAEVQRLRREVSALHRRRQRLQLAVERNALYWTFLEQVLRSAQLEEVRALVGRTETLLLTRTQLHAREAQAQELLDSLRGGLRQDLDRRNRLLMQSNSRLSRLQTELDQARADALGWESRWTHIQNTAARETLLLGQIKTVTFSLFHRTGGALGADQGVEIDDTDTQLDRIQMFIQRQMNVLNEVNPSEKAPVPAET